MKLFIVLNVVALAVLASSTPVANQEESVIKSVIGNVVNCMNSDLTLCLKEQALKATQRLGSVRQIKLFDGVTVLNNQPREAKSLDLSADTEVRRGQVSERLWESTSDLLSNSELELSWDGPDDEEDTSRAMEEGRGKKKKEIKKKLKILIALSLLAKAKAIALVVISLVVIAASLAKLAILAKLAFLAKAIAIIKYLLAKKNEQHEHIEEHAAWIPAPEEHVSHGSHGSGHGGPPGWEGGWSRSRNEGNNLAYSAYAQ